MSRNLKSFFMPFQVAWIKDNSLLKIIEKSRQIGMSWSTAYSAVRRAAVADARQDVWVSSRDDVQAKLFIEDCRHWIKVLQLGAKDLGELVVSGEGRASASVIEFANGRRIYSLSSNPNALAGKRGHVILDEFALHKDQRLLYRIAKPVTQWGGQLEIISTHRGADTVFNEIITSVVDKGNPMGWSHHKVTIHDAVAAGLVEKIAAKSGRPMGRDEWLAEIRAGCMDEEQWLQEYCCVPADESAAFITYGMIQSCQYGFEDQWERYPDVCTGPCYVGVDVGRDHDLTVFWLLEKLGDVYYTRFRQELKAKSFDEQEHELYQLLQHPNVRRCCIDASGIGRQFAERAQKRFGDYKVEQVKFTAPVKEELAFPLRAAFEDRTLRIPDCPKLTTDLRAVKKETTAAGNIRFTADRGKNGHSDRFWALALALHAGATIETAGRFQRVRGSRYAKAAAMRRSRSLLG